MTDTQILAALERCDQELKEIANRPDVIGGVVPAWLVTLGVEDWERERRAIYALLSPEVWPYLFEPAAWGAQELRARAGEPCRLYRLVEHSLMMVRVEFPDGQQALAMREELRPRPVRSCRVCGCTDGDCRGCIERTGQPCSWVDADLCSACAVARCTDCGVAVGGQHRPHCHRQGLVSAASVYGATEGRVNGGAKAPLHAEACATGGGRGPRCE